MPPDPYKRCGSNSDLTGLEGLNRLTRDLKQNIRLIKDCPVLSDAWCEMADFVGRIKSITISRRAAEGGRVADDVGGRRASVAVRHGGGQAQPVFADVVAFRESSVVTELRMRPRIVMMKLGHRSWTRLRSAWVDY